MTMFPYKETRYRYKHKIGDDVYYCIAVSRSGIGKITSIDGEVIIINNNIQILAWEDAIATPNRYMAELYLEWFKCMEKGKRMNHYFEDGTLIKKQRDNLERMIDNLIEIEVHLGIREGEK